MANWAQKLKLHHLQTLVALGETGQPDARRPDDEYLPAGAIEVVISTRR
ncbi:transcriptional regulator [Salmonella enterica subsp. enterica]|uniref:Transcriptional regulator n=1 Tax=Salmonella enterica I TaxID=59201 RepID=A0A3S4JDB8_SALET|nr:transcriptional regulator [Salmonella enterica subsp. enterica]